MSRRIDLRGRRFGRLVALHDVGGDASGARIWQCHCDCGLLTNARVSHLINARIRSCGCLSREESANRMHRLAFVHGDCAGGHVSPEYHTWRNMISRCYNPRTRRYDNYGGRGVTVCMRWRNSFANFLADVGRRPSPQHSLDRIRTLGNYKPSNVRWATRSEQQRNRTCNHLLTVGRRTQTIAAWAEDTGINYTTIHERICRGWTAKRAVTTAPTIRFIYPKERHA